MTESLGRPLTRQITLVCEVLTVPAGDGRFVARIEVVATGERLAVRDVDELLALIRRLADDI